MNLHRTHATLTSFAVSAMLTSSFFTTAPNGLTAAAAGPQPSVVVDAALNGIRAAGWAKTSNDTGPVAIATPQASNPITTASPPIITTAELEKLQKALTIYGHDFDIGPSLMTALGIKTSNLRQLSIRKPNTPSRAFFPLPDGGVLLALVDTTMAKDYRLDANFKLVSAVIMIDGKPSGTPPDAEKVAQAELAYWAQVADRL